MLLTKDVDLGTYCTLWKQVMQLICSMTSLQWHIYNKYSFSAISIKIQYIPKE